MLKDPRLGGSAAQALGFMGREAKAAVPALIEATGSSYEWNRNLAVITLGEIGPEAKAAVPRLIELLRDCTRWDRLHVAQALGERN